MDDSAGKRQKVETGAFTSTRNPKINASFREAILSGYAPDGGLFVPRKLPAWSREDLVAMQSLSYAKLAERLLRSLVPREEVSDEDLRKVIAAAYGNFDPDKVVVVKQLPCGLFVSELFHGPTQCFKDLGLGVVVAFLSHFTPPEEATRTLVVSTTGDTGPAAVHAVVSAANPKLNILLAYPKGQISEYQRKQMTTVVSPNVQVVEFEGGGDDLDGCIKAMATDAAFKDKYGLCGVNSFNIGRPLAQVVHYVWTVLRVAELEQRNRRSGREACGPNKDSAAAAAAAAAEEKNLLLDPSFRVNISIPTGAMGNIAASFLAKLSGLPLGCVCAGVNANDVTFRVISAGDFSVQPAMHKTLSDAINIMCPYNMERLLYYLTGCDSDLISKWYRELEANGKVKLPARWVEAWKEQGFLSARVDDEAMLAEMSSLQSEQGYVACPHSSVGFAAARSTGLFVASSPVNKEGGGGGGGGGEQQQHPCCVMATASACKFQESVTAGLGEGGWAEYASSPLYPASALEILAKPEVQPVLFEAAAGRKLSENQEAWESQMRDIIVSFASPGKQRRH